MTSAKKPEDIDLLILIQKQIWYNGELSRNNSDIISYATIILLSLTVFFGLRQVGASEATLYLLIGISIIAFLFSIKASFDNSKLRREYARAMPHELRGEG